MDRGLRGAPAACTLLVLGIGLQLYPEAAEVVHFGPLFLKVNETSDLGNHVSPTDQAVDDSPAITSADPASSPTMTPFLIDTTRTVENTDTVWPLYNDSVLQDDVLLMPSLIVEPSILLETSHGLQSSIEVEVWNEVSSDVVVSSTSLQATPLSEALNTILNIPSNIFPEQSVMIPKLESSEPILWSTTLFPLPTEYTKLVSTDFEVESSVVESSLLSTRSHFDSSLEGTLVVSSTQEASLPPQPFPLESSIEKTSLAITEDVTSISTKNPLYTIFSNLGLIAAEDSTTSSGLSIPMTASSHSSEVSYTGLLEVSESLLVESKESAISLVPVPTVTPEHDQTSGVSSHTTVSDLMYTLWWSDSYVQTPTINPSGSGADIAETSTMSIQEFPVESSVEVVESVYSSLPIVSLSFSATNIWDSSSVDSSRLIDSSFYEDQKSIMLASQSLEMETQLVSVVDSVADSSTLIPSLTELLMSSLPFDELESTFIITPSLPASTPLLDSSVYESMNTVEAPAFVMTESGMYFTQTLTPILEKSEDLSELLSGHLSVVSTPDLSSMFPSPSEDLMYSSLSSETSALSPQNFSSVFAISESMFSSSVLLETYFTSLVESVSEEVASWQVSYSSVLSSLAPSSSADWELGSPSVYSEFSEIWGVTPTVQSELSVLYTSSFQGATSLLPLTSSYALSPETSSLSTFSSDHTSSALIDRIPQTSLFTVTPGLPESMSTPVVDISETSLFSWNTSPSVGLSSSPVLSTEEPFTVHIPVTVSSTSTVSLLSSPNVTTMLLSPSTLNFLPTMVPPATVTLPWSTHTLWSTPTFSSSNLAPTTTPAPVVATTVIPTSSTPTVPHVTQDTTTPTTDNRVTTESTTTTAAPATPPSGLTASLTTSRPILVCDISNPEPYLVTAALSRGSNIRNITESIRDLLTSHFNRSLELEVYSVFEKFSFMVTSGSVVYTAIAVGNILRLSSLLSGPFPPILSLQTSLLGLDPRFHVQTVLQFVPPSVDIRLCTFSERIRDGLSTALYEVRRLRQESDNFTVQMVNITSSPLPVGAWKAPVTVTYAVRDRYGFINGSDISDQLRNLTLVEFSFFLGFPVKQIAEPSTYPQLNVSPLLKDSWLRTVLLGVPEQQLRGDAFPAEMERKLAQLITAATSQKRRWKRASYAGSNAVQVVEISRLDGSDDPVKLVYFIEDQYGGRLAADKASALINEVNIQQAAIILGYRLQGAVAQPLNQAQESERQAQNLWIIVGVAVPVLVVTVIIVILYWKLCRTDKLDFQPDTMSNLQQRQKLQAPSVKGFDFAKQHLGQHSKDEILVVHEPPPPALHGPLKDSTPSENGDIPTPKSKGSGKPSKVGRHRSSRVTPSDAGSTASEPSSGKESGEEESPQPSAPPREIHLRSTTKGEMPVFSSGTEQHSSASIFEHVDRMSRSSEASRRLPSKIQLIAMQPMATPPMHGLSVSEREMEANKINREIQTTLRHKSEIEHHRNKIRLRAKRKGHYEFPLVDVVGMADTKERQRIYRRAQMQFDKILDPVLGVPTVFIEPRRSSRSRRSPKQRRKQQGSSSPPDADRDRLITTDSDGTYKRPPGVSNSAYVSDPDVPSDDPSPVGDLGRYPASPPHLPVPAQYVAPQPSIEEVRQTMQSLLDDAFALVAPSSQGPGTVQSGSTSGQPPVSSTPVRPGRGAAPWGGQYPAHHSSHYSRFAEFGGAPPASAPPAPAPGLLPRSPGFSSGFLPPAEVPATEPGDPQYPSRSYQEDIPSVARPRPLGSNSGSAHIQQLTQVGIASRMGAQPGDLAASRSGQQLSGGPGWVSYFSHDEEIPRNVLHRDARDAHGAQEYAAPQMYRGPGHRAPASHLPPSMAYPSAEDVHLGHSSASLIKAIREELLRLSQKQAVTSAYHS